MPSAPTTEAGEQIGPPGNCIETAHLVEDFRHRGNKASLDPSAQCVEFPELYSLVFQAERRNMKRNVACDIHLPQMKQILLLESDKHPFQV